MKKYPLKLNYISKSAIWGGDTLSNQWGKAVVGDNVAETWELTVRKNEMSKITNGEAAGMTLAEYIGLLGESVVSGGYESGDLFPLLVKFIDAGDKLSVQVHPDDAYAQSAGELGKTEAWYIVDAKEGAEIIYGLADGVDKEAFKDAVYNGGLDKVLKRVPVKSGECYFIPSGMLHAIGEGILIAEIQQNSDLTYRVYDYDRIGADGQKRPLHREKAIDVVRPYTEEQVEQTRFSEGREEGMLVNCEYFSIRRVDVSGDTELFVGDEFTSVLCIQGNGRIEFDGEAYEIGRGDSYFLPAGMGKADLFGSMTLLCSKPRA